MPTHYRHLFLGPDRVSSENYSRPLQGFNTSEMPSRNHTEHGSRIKSSLNKAWEEAQKQSEERKALGLETHDGVYISIRGAQGYKLPIPSLEDKKKGIRIANAYSVDRVNDVVLFVPMRHRNHLLKKIEEYEATPPAGDKPQHQALIATIEDIKRAVLESFWTDAMDLIPQETKRWCELWLLVLDRNQDGESQTVNQFKSLAQAFEIELKPQELAFPERTVLMARLHRKDMDNLIQSSPSIAEFRLAKEPAYFFLELSPHEQFQAVEELQGRISMDQATNVSVNILDTGVNHEHILLQPMLPIDNLDSVLPEWGTADHDGHGTLMSGLAAYGDLQKALESNEAVNIRHWLEAVKILPPRGENPADLYGYYTKQAIARAEIKKPEYTRLNCMAVTASDHRDQGRPSSWSAAVDQLCSGYDDGKHRLLIISTGNLSEREQWARYPESNKETSIQDPGQAWNALTIGAYTEKGFSEEIPEAVPVAQPGSLSPYSTTSHSWNEKKWPLKPELVFEGGNVANHSNFISSADSLGLLSTYYRVNEKQFGFFNATSAATAQAAHMAAQLQVAYPNAWPETIRALMIHSAEWTEAMKAEFLDNESKGSYSNLIKICGYGVPNFQRAVSCMQNQLTLVTENTITPFKREKSVIKFNEMHFYELPWPREQLKELGETDVKLKITLSYFIEPGPGEIGWNNRYRYPSHGFRFALKNAGQRVENFRQRINSVLRDIDPETNRPVNIEQEGDTNKNWVIGPDNRGRGSVHSDFMTISAVELADCDRIAVFPIAGWWRYRDHLNRWNKTARYSLIISIDTPNLEADIYTPVVQQLEIPIEKMITT